MYRENSEFTTNFLFGVDAGGNYEPGSLARGAGVNERIRQVSIPGRHECCDSEVMGFSFREIL